MGLTSPPFKVTVGTFIPHMLCLGTNIYQSMPLLSGVKSMVVILQSKQEDLEHFCQILP